jgi:MYXO-CTERM domain-containing protein
LPLLQKHLPPPDGWTDAEFYMCVASGGASLTTTGTPDDTCVMEAAQLQFDAEAFADDFDERIVQPGLHAIDLLSEWPYLTRLFTTISPDEMTVDPMFLASPELTLGVSQSRRATQFVQCVGDRTVTLPDARVVALNGTSWPTFSSAMPWVERIEELNDDGELVVLVDNSELIDEQLAEWNALSGVNVNPSATSSGGTGTGNSGSDSSSTGGNGNDSSGTGGQGGESSDSGGSNASGTGGGGCNCSVPGGQRGTGLLLVSLLGLGVAGARRRRRA